MATRTATPRFTELELHDLFTKAEQAGREAAQAAIPAPIQVFERANPFDGTSSVVKSYAPIMDGVCGYAWITIRPGNGQAAKFAKAQGKGRSDPYEGGVTVKVRGYGQSMARKEAYAYAYAAVLYAAGIRAYADSRMD